MRWRTFWSGMVVAAGLTGAVGTPATTWAQTGAPAYYANINAEADSDDGASRLPATDDGGSVATTSAEMPSSSGSANARVAALEAKIAELDAMLKDEPKKENKGYVVGSDRGLLGKFTNDGAAFSSKNGDFKWKMRGLAQLDFIGLQNAPGGLTTPGGAGTQDSVDFRRLRLGAEGTMYETIDWVFETDLAFALQNVDPTVGATPTLGLRSTGTVASNQAGNTIGVIQPTTIFMTFTTLPIIGNVRVGNQQSWISLEHIESARFLDFMERSPLMDAFNGPNNNGYQPGISVFNMTDNKRAAWELGAYKTTVYDSGYPYDIGNANYTFGARGTWCPYYDEPSEGRYMLHLGCGSEYRLFNTQNLANTQGDNVRLRTRGDLRNTDSTLCPNYTDTGNFFAASQGTFCPELAFQWGSLLIQAEYQQAYMNSAATSSVKTGPNAGTALGQLMFQGGYVEALYFLTGENRQYNRQSGVFNRVIPFQNYGFARGAGCCGWGAIQPGIRYDWMDLNSGNVKGGNCQNFTFGLNWFLNPNARFQINYVASFINNMASPLLNGTTGYLSSQTSRFSGEGTINAVGARMDFNF